MIQVEPETGAVTLNPSKAKARALALKRSKRRALVFGGAGFLAGAIAVQLLSFTASPWHPASEHPQPYLPVIITTHSGWEKGYFDEAGDARSYQDGLPIFGAHNWREISEP